MGLVETSIGQRGRPFEPWVSVRVAPPRMKDGAGLHLAAELAAALPVGRPEMLGRDAYAVHPRPRPGVMREGDQAGTG